MTEPWILYGASGYTGALIAHEAVRRGHAPILAGRSAEAVGPVARALGLDSRLFGLDDPRSIRAGLGGARAVVHCAGPFAGTSRPMVDACLATGVHYLDITGEIDVFESIFARDDEAKRAGVSLIPGVGFDVVPTDCIAAILADALPEAVALDLGICMRGGGLSRGTRRTMISRLPRAGAIRRDGAIVEVPLAWHVREIPFPCGVRRAMTIPWGDVSTAFHTTGIPNIRVYLAAPPAAMDRTRWIGRLAPVLGLRPVRSLLLATVRAGGPDARARERGRVELWAEVRSATDERATMTAEVPEGYAFTAVAAVRAVETILAGTAPHGASTPSRAFGATFLASIEGVALSPVIHTP